MSIALRSIINKRLKAMEAGERIQDDLLGILLQSNSEEIKANKNMKSGLSVDDIIEECKLFYLAGQETTSTLLVWTMILLSQHTEWQERAREEVLQTFGNRTPDIDGLNHLKIVSFSSSLTKLRTCQYSNLLCFFFCLFDFFVFGFCSLI